MKSTLPSALELVKLCCRALDEKKAVDPRVLDVSEQSSITDYLVLATGTSEPHLRALRVELEKAIDASRTRIIGMEIAPDSGWIVIDAFDVMIHLFTAETRAKYGLENLWKDAVDGSVSTLLATPKVRKATAKAAPRKTPVRKKPATQSKPARSKTSRKTKG